MFNLESNAHSLSAGPVGPVSKPAYGRCYCLMTYADWLAWSGVEEEPLSWDSSSTSASV
jgi:hypothetical protein